MGSLFYRILQFISTAFDIKRSEFNDDFYTEPKPLNKFEIR